MSWRKAWFGATERIDEVRDEIFLGGALFDGAGFIFDDDFVVGDFDDFVTRDGETRFGKGLKEGAIDDELLDHEAIGVESEVVDFAKAGAFFGDDFLAGESEVKRENLFYFDDVATRDEFVDAVNYHTVARIFADAGDIEDIGRRAIGSDKADDLEAVWVDNGAGYAGDKTAGLDTKNRCAGKAAVHD